VDRVRTITSLGNETVKAVRALHMKKAREESGLYLAEGLKIVTEAVELGHAPRILLFGPDAREHPLLKSAVRACEAGGGEALEVTREILEKVSRRENPQAVVGVFPQSHTPLEALQPKAAPCWVALEAVRDPGNLGTIVRTADAAGCGGVILVGDCVDPFSVEAVRATMGSIFAVSIARATAAEFLAWRRSWPGSVVGTLLNATHDYRAAPYRRPTLVLMGNEQQGLTGELAAVCDVNVKIPMRGRADSLNLAVATGIMIYVAMEGV
jgi:RNA methyltransferase, TrmH family